MMTPSTLDEHERDDPRWPIGALSSQLRDTQNAAKVLDLLLNPRKWVVRRKEQLEFQSATQITRRMSVTLLVPEMAPQLRIEGRDYRVLPLTYIRKRKLVSFDLRMENGAALAMLPTSFGRRLAGSMLKQLAEELFEDGDRIRGDLDTLFKGSTEDKSTVHIDEENTKESVKRIFETVKGLTLKDGVTEDAVEIREAYRTLLLRLALNLLCLILMEEAPGTVRVLKYTLTEPVDTSDVHESPTAKLSMRLGWRPWQVFTPIPAAVNSNRHHVEMKAPEGTELVIGRVVAIVPAEDPVISPPERYGTSEGSTAWARWGTCLQGRRGREQRARELSINRLDREPKERTDYPATSLHLAMSLDKETACKLYAVFAVRLERKGWLRVSLCCCAVATSVLLLLGRYSAVVSTTGSTAPASPSPAILLLSLLSLAASLLTRSSEHALASEMLKYIRWLVILVCLAPVAGAMVVLAHSPEELPDVKRWFTGLGLFCLVVTAMLGRTFLRSGPVKEGTLQRREPPEHASLLPLERCVRRLPEDDQRPVARGGAASRISEEVKGLRHRRRAQLALALRFNEGSYEATDLKREAEEREKANVPRFEATPIGTRYQSAPYSIDRNALVVANDIRISGLRIGTAEANRYALRNGWDARSLEELRAAVTRILERAANQPAAADHGPA